ncbi:MAG: hypothetical protein M1815_003084 [Lichina confinis]|nr:MAG: hypothetical protein M1815_003084 [Lichina confinis]
MASAHSTGLGGDESQRTSRYRDRGDQSTASDPKSVTDRLKSRSTAMKAADHTVRRSGGFLLDNNVVVFPSGGDNVEGGSFHTNESQGARRTGRYQTPVKRSSQQEPLSVSKQRGGSEGMKRYPSRHEAVDDVVVPASSTASPTTPHQAQGRDGKRRLGNHDGRDGDAAGSSPLDSDSTRLVNLALNLSQARHRSSSYSMQAIDGHKDGKRSASGVTQRLERRPTPGTPGSAAARDDGGAQRPKARRKQRDSSLSQSMAAEPWSSFHGGQRLRSPVSKPRSASHMVPMPGDLPDFEPHLSKATAERTQRAKRYFELSAEYRRLLQLLPPLDPVADTRWDGSATGATSAEVPKSLHSSAAASSGRPYNLLQAIRNRRSRRRARESLDPDPASWTQLPAVRAWVDRIEERIAESAAGQADAAMLVPFPSGNVDDNGGNADDVPRPAVISGSSRQKPSRMDWSIAPEELLADAYWVEQDEHKALVENRDGLKIYPRPERRGSSDDAARLQRDLAERWEQPKRALSLDMSGGRKKKHSHAMSNVERASHSIGPFRRRQQHGLHGSFDADTRNPEDGTPRRHRWFGRRKASEDSSAASEASTTTPVRTARGDLDVRHSMDDMDRARLEKQVFDMLAKEAGERDSRALEERSDTRDDDTSDDDDDDDDVDGNRRGGRRTDPVTPKNADRYSTSLHSPPGHFSHLDSALRFNRGGDAPSFKSLTLDHQDARKRSFDSVTAAVAGDAVEAGSARSTLSGAPGFAPSIATTLSPGQSRGVSPVRNRPTDGGAHPASSRQSLSAEPPRLLEKNDIETTDFAADDTAKQLATSSRASIASDRITALRRRQSPEATRVSVLQQEEEDEEAKPGHTLLKKRSTQGSQPDLFKFPVPRFRGVLKGVRIDEAIRKEVAKLGHFIWRREAPADPAEPSPSSSSGSGSSNSDDILQDARPRKQSTFDSAQEPSPTDDAKVSRTNTADESSRYHSGLLPSFTPASAWTSAPRSPRPLPVDRSPQENSGTNSLRSVRPAAVRDVSDPSLMNAPTLSRVSTSDSTVAPADSRWRSTRYGQFSNPLAQTAPKAIREAGDRLNAILGMAGRTKLPVTALAGLDPASQGRASERRRSDCARDRSEGRCGPHVSKQMAWRRDMARVEARLLSSGVKAQEILRRGEVLERISPSLLGGCDDDDDDDDDESMMLARRTKLHVAAAQVVLENMQQTKRNLEAAIEAFTGAGSTGLAQQLSRLQGQLSSDLTPKMRAYADEADAFSTELMTTYTLTIKEVNDSIELVMRQRRRRLRWLRRGAYLSLEWALLGIMWCLWLIFVVVRLVRVSMRAVWMGLRWILWL